MATEHDRVSADEARELLNDFPATAALSWEKVRDGAHVAVHGAFFYDRDGHPVVVTPGEAALYDRAHALAHTVITQEAEVAELHAETARLTTALRATARACTLPEDTAPAALPAQVEACIRDLSGQIEQLTAERDRLQRACDEGLPREVIHCPACGRRHLDGANGVEFATKPHHTHLCQHCGHIWDHGRWSFGAPDELVSPPVPWFDAPTHRGLWWAHLTHADEQERMDVVQAAQDPYGDWYLRFVGEPTPLYLANLRGAGAKVRFTPALSPTNASPITWGKAPTVAEAIAHAKAHNQWAKWPDDGPMGAWLTRSGSTVEVFELSVTDRGTVHDITHDRAWDGGGGEWLPLDANHLPCARPVVTGETHKEGNDNEFDHV